jgi:hypothetical protein
MSTILKAKPQGTMEEEVELTDGESSILKYSSYDFDRINQERFFNNLGMFVKLTSGAYSLEERPVAP